VSGWDGDHDLYFGMSLMEREVRAQIPHVGEQEAIERMKNLLVDRGADRNLLFLPDAVARR
jgi:hypothetical protein